MKSRYLFVAASAALLVPAYAFAGPSCDKAAVAKLVKDANTAFGAQHYPEAVTAYEAAYACNHDASLLFNVAKADLEVGRYVDGLSAMRQFEKDSPDLSKDVRGAADDVIGQLSAHVGTLTVHSSTPGAHVTIGDKDAGVTPLENVEVPEGSASVRVTLNGRDVVRSVDVKGGKHASVDADFSATPSTTGPNPTPTPTPPTKKPASIHPLVWAGVAVGGAGLIVGIGTGAASLAQTSSLKSKCPTMCTKDQLSTANTLANVSNVSFGIAGAGAILGIVGAVLTVGSSSKTEATSLVVGPGSLELRGAF